MKHILWFALAALLLSAGVVAAEDEAPMKKCDVPEAVCKAFEKAYPNVEVVSYDKDIEGEQTQYEIKTKVGEFEKDYVYLEDGALLQIEEGIPIEALPELIVESVMKAHPDGEIDEAEKITRGSAVEYEVVVEVGEAEYEMLLASDGKIVSSETLDDEDAEGDTEADDAEGAEGAEGAEEDN